MMELIYYQSPHGNVGDDLNPWLWPKLLGKPAEFQDLNFIGIGSVLDTALDSWLKEPKFKKVIFGAGIRNYLFDPRDWKDVDVMFVRGPVSSKAFGGAKYITDSAYCLSLLNLKIPSVKKYECAYVPYFTHMHHFDWRLFELLTGIKVISPLLKVEEFIVEISKAKKIFTSAMHGAILADIFRIPWCRLRLNQHGGESSMTSELKWFDWCSSMNIYPKTLNVSLNMDMPRPSRAKEIAQILLMKRFFSRHSEFTLSEDKVYAEKIMQLSEAVDTFKKRYSL